MHFLHCVIPCMQFHVLNGPPYRKGKACFTGIGPAFLSHLKESRYTVYHTILNHDGRPHSSRTQANGIFHFDLSQQAISRHSLEGGRREKSLKNVTLALSHPAALAVGVGGGPVLLRPGRQARRGQGQGQDAGGRSSRCRWQDRGRRAGRQVERWEPDLSSRGAAEEGKRSLFI